MSNKRILVVGTTPDYIAYLQEFFPRRALFLTDISKRAGSTEAAPDSDTEIVCDLVDYQQVLQALQEHLDRYKQALSGIVCYDCEWLSLASKLGKFYKLPYPELEAVELCRNKYLTKLKWQEYKVRCPKVELIQKQSEAFTLIKRFGNPVVLKPLTGSGSELTFQCRNIDELTEAYLTIKTGLKQRSRLPMYNLGSEKKTQDVAPDILAEELITGTEYSADFILENGELHIVRIARKISDKEHPFGTTSAYIIPADLPVDIDIRNLKNKLLRAASVLGFERAICMVDFIVSGEEIVFLELTPRIGGDCIPPLVRKCSGLDTIGLALEFGEAKEWKIPPPGQWKKHIGIRIFARQNGIFSHINSDGLLEDSRVKEVYLKIIPGHEVTLPPDDYDSWILGHVTIEPLPEKNELKQVKEIMEMIVVHMKQEYSSSYIQQITEILHQQETLLPQKELKTFVQSFIDRKEDFLKIVNHNGSPLYVIDTDALKNRNHQFKMAFADVLPSIKIYYALKSNSHPLIVSTLVEQGTGIDVSSGIELKSAMSCGSKDIVFSGPGKSDSELELAVDNHEIVTVLIDSFEELKKLQRIAAQKKITIRAGVRITTDDYGIWRKFGIPLKRLNDFFAAASNCPNIDLKGLQFHLSWNLHPDKQVNFIKRLGMELDNFNGSFHEQIKFIDIGGGFWPEQGEWLQYAATPRGMVEAAVSECEIKAYHHYKKAASSIEDFANQISETLNASIPATISCTYCFEPGRWLCNEAMHILLRVADVKASDIVITDGGTNAVGWDRFETDYFPVINLTRPALVEKECLIAGSLCTPHDIWGYSYFGEEIKENDVLIVPHQGAYTYSLKQEFIKPLPACAELQNLEVSDRKKRDAKIKNSKI